MDTMDRLHIQIETATGMALRLEICEFNGQFYEWEVDWREVGNLILGVGQANG